MDNFLQHLHQTLVARKSEAPDKSYVASLYHKGLNKILEKVGEEATETLLAAKDAEHSSDKTHLIYETADLWFHSMVMLAHFDLSPADIINELERREGVSGLAEKAARKHNGD